MPKRLRIHSSDFKAKVASAALKKLKTVSQLASQTGTISAIAQGQVDGILFENASDLRNVRSASWAFGSSLRSPLESTSAASAKHQQQPPDQGVIRTLRR